LVEGGFGLLFSCRCGDGSRGNAPILSTSGEGSGEMFGVVNAVELLELDFVDDADDADEAFEDPPEVVRRVLGRTITTCGLDAPFRGYFVTASPSSLTGIFSGTFFLLSVFLDSLRRPLLLGRELPLREVGGMGWYKPMFDCDRRRDNSLRAQMTSSLDVFERWVRDL